MGTEAGEGWSNRLVEGDNLPVLQALDAEFRGQAQCCFIDPPYNSGSTFTHFLDEQDHALWLSFMRDRLEWIRSLLARTGSLWIAIDSRESHYLKVLCDELFGRENFVANVVWQKRTSPDARVALGTAHDDLLVYARDASRLSLNPLPLSLAQARAYRNWDNDPRGPWMPADFTAQGWRANQMYPITMPDGTVQEPPPGRCWGGTQASFERLLADNRIWFGAKRHGRPRVKSFLAEREGIAAWTWWDKGDVGHNQQAKRESNALFGHAQAFDTPKPERLLKRVLDIATRPGDLVLDCFAGSGTTGAVAQKTDRRWIMVESGAQCRTHIVPRLCKVIAGTDPGGVSEEAAWNGGGAGFRFYTIEPEETSPLRQ